MSRYVLMERKNSILSVLTIYWIVLDPNQDISNHVSSVRRLHGIGVLYRKTDKKLNRRFSIGKVKGQPIQRTERAVIRWQTAEGRKLQAVLWTRFVMERRLRAASNL